MSLISFETINIRKTITYIFIGILFLAFYEYFWSDLSSFWQKIAMIITAVFLFSLIKDFIFWVFSYLSSFWAFIFKSIIVILAFLLSWFYIFTDYSDNDFKENHTEIRNDVRNFFALPTSSPFAKKHEDVLIVPSSKEANRDSVVDLLLNKNNTTHTNTVQKENSTTTINTINNTDSTDSTDSTDKTNNTDNTNNTENKSTTDTNSTNNTTSIELTYIKDANKNWKTPIQKELQEDEGLIFSRKLQSKVNTSQYKPTATILATPEKNTKNNANYLYFTKTPVQVTYPQQYAFKNTHSTTTTNKAGLIEEITTDIYNTKTQETEATAQYQIYTSGKLYNKYVNEFITVPSSSSNTFYLESATPNSVQYVTFFAGKCWVITLTKEGNNNILDDFYKILIPAVFEAQD